MNIVRTLSLVWVDAKARGRARGVSSGLPGGRLAGMARGSSGAGAASMLLAAVLVSVLASVARGQTCGGQWLPGDGYPGVNGSVLTSVEWDPDGDGPMTPKIVLGGGFNAAGTIAVRNIATFDRATGEWGTLGSGFDKTVWALAALADGSLVAAGSFTDLKGFARWDGTSWKTLGPGLQCDYPGVNSIIEMPNGDLVVAGNLWTLGGNVTIQKIARWNGQSWAPLGGDSVVNSVYDAVRLADGSLVAAGSIFIPSLGAWRSVARWDGTAWQAMGNDLFSSEYQYHSSRALAVDSQGRLISGGGSSPNDLRTHIYRLDGETWSELGTGIRGKYPFVQALTVAKDGTIYAGGWYPDGNGAQWADSLARWSGDDWNVIAQTDGGVESLTALSTGEVVVGGSFRDKGIGAGIIDDSTSYGWKMLSGGVGTAMLMAVNSIVALSDRDVIVSAYDVYTDSERVLRWDGLRWTYPGLSGRVCASLPMPDGDDVVSGNLYGVGYLAKGRGKTWKGFAPGLNGLVRRLLRLSNGDILACGEFTKAGTLTVNRIARWDGTKWNALGTGLDGYVRAIAVMPDGQIFAGGEFTTAGGKSAKNIARWDGVEWHAVGAGTTGPVRDMVVMPNGDLIVCGLFNKIAGVTAASVARWNGSVWSKMGSGLNDDVRELAVTPTGDVVAVGNFTTPKYVARWDGTSWKAMGTGTGGQYPQGVALDVSPNGDIYIGGQFETAGGMINPNFARWTATGAPAAAADPEDRFVDVFFDAEFTATPSRGYENVSVRWLRNGMAIKDGPDGASEGGGVVEGATGALSSPTNGTPATLTIRGVRSSDAGEYTAVFFNDCGESASEPATLRVPCLADLDATGFVDTDDFDAFTKAYEDGAPAADIDRSGFVDKDDFDLFVESFEAGC